VVRVVAFVAAGVAALSAPSFAGAYHWPVKPFDRQHPIRGAFDDPRFGGTFHFGVDISAPDGTAVYAVAPGTVFRYSDAVAVRQPDGHEFSYWHVRGTVKEHSYVTTGEQIGVIRRGFGHVHFAEFNGKTYVNPLRLGALAPFVDHTKPVVGPIVVDENGTTISATVEAYDRPPMKPPWPWQNATWTPAIIRWRLLDDGATAVPWRTAVNSSVYHSRRDYHNVYAPGTIQNLPGRSGRYVFWLTHRLTVPAGRYDLEVEASDTRGNTGTGSLLFDVDQSSSTEKLSSR
jgi:Peptidase family M23